MNQKNKKITSYFVIFSLLLIGIIYAILQANLQINGIAKIKSNSWNIHFDNIQVNENSVSIGTGDSQATIDPENNCKVDFEVTLSIPGDFYEFTVDVVNAGTIDGMIGELNKTLKVNNEVVSEVPDYLTYSVTYADGLEILENHKLEVGDTETYKVKLEFNTNIEELPEAATISTSLEPQYIQADTGAINRPAATFIDGKSFNARIKKLSGTSNATYDSYNTNITAFRKSNTLPDMNTMTSDNMVSVNLSKPIYIWFDNGTIYYYSDSKKVYLNEDSSYMFSNLKNCAIFEVKSFDTSRTTNMSHMFGQAGNEVTTFSLDLAGWNVSNVEDLSYMFDGAGWRATTYSLDLSNWNPSSATNLSYIFCSTGYNATNWSISDLSSWDTSNVTNMRSAFLSAGDNATTFSFDLSSWNTSSVTTMYSMFSYSGEKSTTWSIGDLSNWDTSSVTDISDMFNNAGKNATTWNSIGTLEIYTTSVVNLFQGCSNAKATLRIYNNQYAWGAAFSGAATVPGSGITVDYTSSVTNIDSIIATKSSNSNVIKGSLFTP